MNETVWLKGPIPWLTDAYEKKEDRELKLYEDGYLHGLEKALEIIQKNMDFYKDLHMYVMPHQEMIISIKEIINKRK